MLDCYFELILRFQKWLKLVNLLEDLFMLFFFWKSFKSFLSNRDFFNQVKFILSVVFFAKLALLVPMLYLYVHTAGSLFVV